MRVTVLVIGFVFSSIALVACNGGVTQGSNLMPVTPAVHPDKKSDLLYISDAGTGDVYVYTYPQGVLSQTLTGFTNPSGQCVDKQGDVFITDGGGSEIYEYAHGGSSPIATLSDPNADPQGCSVDFKTGDLAVANVVTDGGSDAGNVAIYKKAKGSPKTVSDSAIFDVGYCGYDPHGDLFIDGLKKNTVTIAELVKGGSTFTNLKVTGATFYGSGGVQWAGSFLAVGDGGSKVYQLSISKGKATEKGSTSLTGAYNLVDFWIQGHDIIGPNGGSGNVGIWKYPAGGTAIKFISGFTEAVGATVSAGK